MLSQNDSIFRHPKEACLGSIIARKRLNLEMIIERREAPLDTSSEVDVESILVEASLPTPTSGPLGTSAFTPSQTPSYSVTSQPPRITQVILLKICHLAPFADVRASRLEAVVPWIIERAISAALTPLWTLIDALTFRLETFERGYGVTTEVKVLKADVSELWKDVDHLKSTDFTSLFVSAEIPGVAGVDVPGSCDMPPATTEDETMEDVATFE
ncbi:hypothetical protein H5410_040907 [Solanum commersonii]|uniref:Polyprotein protein n=1 Tax=Solanum commersonii TaxID=4109 RepID=A0A9J5XQA7_SOLCO|nr:hypothetical protein H5410_040907 [Solanum commersonii]